MSRYIPGDLLLVGDARWRPFPAGQCQWCGKLLPKGYRTFCAPEERQTYPDSPHTFKYPACAIAYSWYWYTRPRFQRLILLRDNFTCQQCGLRPTAVSEKDGIERPDLHLLHIDHIVPYSKCYKTEMSNLQVLCAQCNLKKGAKES